jgi:hypothetical protein
MAVSAVVAAVGTAGLYQQNQAQQQQKGQFQQQAAMEAERQQQEFQLGQENLAQQQQALNAQNAAFAAQQSAAARAQADANKQATLADIANNRATRKTPNIGAMLTGNDKAGASGAGSTLLTGAGGASSGTLGRANLLGS